MNSTAAPNNYGPIFVLGAARSGTTIVSSALEKMTGFRSLGEGHIWPLVLALSRLSQRYYAGLSAIIDDSHQCLLFEHNSEELTAGIIQAVLDLYGIARTDFIDKTPGVEMISCTDMLSHVYKNAFFIFVKRGPIATIRSKLKKFPDVEFSNHCLDWVNCLNAWDDIKQHVANSYYEINHADLVERPETIATELAERLGYEPHAASQFVREITVNTQVERTSADHSVNDNDVANTEWDEKEKSDFRRICEGTAAKFGFDIFGNSSGEGKIGKIALFFPMHESEEAYVVNRNAFCYPVSHGFQLCPNSSGEGVLALHFKNVCLKERRQFSLTVRREFLHGPDVMLRIAIVETTDGSIRNVVEELIDTITPKKIAFAIDRAADIVDLEIGVHILGHSNNHYATIIINSPTISELLSSPA